MTRTAIRNPTRIYGMDHLAIRRRGQFERRYLVVPLLDTEAQAGRPGVGVAGREQVAALAHRLLADKPLLAPFHGDRVLPQRCPVARLTRRQGEAALRV